MANVKIKLTRGTVVNGRPQKKGWIGTVSKEDATYLMSLKKAVPAGKQTKKEEG